jgi:hypothetical protein
VCLQAEATDPTPFLALCPARRYREQAVEGSGIGGLAIVNTTNSGCAEVGLCEGHMVAQGPEGGIVEARNGYKGDLPHKGLVLHSNGHRSCDCAPTRSVAVPIA